MDNRPAFCAVIRFSEGTAKAPNPYAVVYGFGHTITDFSDHPAITGEWLGVSIANLGPQYAHEISTAAGAYQINRPTWREAKAACHLSDFTPASQDIAALWLIDQCHALAMVDRGDFANAVRACSAKWASLPGGNSRQPEVSLAALTFAYKNAGGEVMSA